MRISLFWIGAGLLSVCAAAGSSTAEEYQGATAVVRQLAHPSPDAAAGQFPVQLELKSFRAKATSLPPAEAASGWLKLLDRYLDPRAAQERQDMLLSFSDLMGALPPPSSWSAIAAGIDSRRAASKEPSSAAVAAWGVVSDMLKGDPTVVWDDEEQVAKRVQPAAPNRGSMAAYAVRRMLSDVASQSGDPEQIARAVEAMARLSSDNWGGLNLPDLVALVGAERAETILRKVLVEARASITIYSGDATRKLAQKLALELVAKLRVPQWGLAQSPDAVALYRAMKARFPKPGQRTWDRDHARGYAVAGLIRDGKIAEAAAEALHGAPIPGYDFTNGLDAVPGSEEGTLQFFRTVLTRSPGQSLWSEYIAAAARGGRSNEVVDLLRKLLADPKVSATIRVELRTQLDHALLAADRVDEAVATIRGVLADPAPAAVKRRGELAAQLMHLGQALDRRDWFDEGQHVAAAKDRPPLGDEKELAELLENSGQRAEAERVLMEGISRHRDEATNGNRNNVIEYYVDLVGVYHRAGREADVLSLVERLPLWPAADLSELLTVPDRRDLTLGFMVAAALAKQGKTDRAVSILQAGLREHGDYDPAFELLVSLQKEQALPFLAELAARDRFEERPLIWKAVVLFRAGRLEEAEAVARAAIAIDPSDGEQRFGRRMRVYAVLADIREARGDREQAQFFRGAVDAIRIAERADSLREAGLLRRAILKYQEALTHFVDAYCIQSRLAIQLAGMGKMQEAEAHFRRAYELMPNSFGRMESHCFGCEGVFRGKRAQAIAEKVFTDLLKEHPEKPQLHYLLGYLREVQERWKEALAEYREAVRRDPDYLNAWRHLRDVGARAHVSQVDRDRASVALLRLDPLGRHVGDAGGSVMNLRALWSAAAERSRLTESHAGTSLFPLPAATLAMRTPNARMFNREWEVRQLRMRDGRGYEYLREGRIGSPGDQLAGQQVLSAAGQILDQWRNEALSQ